MPVTKTEPTRKFAMVRGVKSYNVYLRLSPDVQNGWHQVGWGNGSTFGFGTDLTWGEVKFYEPDGIEILYSGPTRGNDRPEES